MSGIVMAVCEFDLVVRALVFVVFGECDITKEIEKKITQKKLCERFERGKYNTKKIPQQAEGTTRL